MKPLPFLFVGASCLLAGCSGSANTTPLHTLPAVPAIDFEQVRASATAENKQIFVEFSASWCGPCQEMKRDTFANPQVQDRLAAYVAVFVDWDHNRPLARQFKVNGIPAYFVVKADGTILKAGAGYRGPKEFLHWLDGLW